MKLFDKLKALGKNIGSYAVSVYNGYEKALNTYTEQLEAENRLAKLSSYRFVEAFCPIAKELSERTENTYIQVLSDAGSMFLKGDNEADVLDYYIRCLETERKNKSL